MPRRRPLILEKVSDIAAFFGVSPRTIGKWFDAGCPGRGGDYDLYQFVQWWCRERQGGNQDKSIDTDLKRRRLEQLIKSEVLDYAERVDELMPRADASLIFETVASELRKAGELLRRQFGDDAQLVILEALDSIEQILAKRFRA